MNEPLISIDEIYFKYSKRNILDNITVTLHKGELVSLLGPNGAGKSTLLKCIIGMLKPYNGSIKLNGLDICKMSFADRANYIAYVPQHSSIIFDHSVRDYITMGVASRYSMWESPSKEDKMHVDSIIEKMELTDLAEAEFRTLSGGEQQKAAIARALVQKPQIILFDEPTSALDIGNQKKVLTMIKDLAQEGYSIILTTHNPNHPFVLKSNVWMLNDKGGIISGELEQVMTSQNISDLYGVNVNVVNMPEYDTTVCIT